MSPGCLAEAGVHPLRAALPAVLTRGFPLISPRIYSRLPPRILFKTQPQQPDAKGACEIPRDGPMGGRARFASGACHCQVIDKAIS